MAKEADTLQEQPVTSTPSQRQYPAPSTPLQHADSAGFETTTHGASQSLHKTLPTLAEVDPDTRMWADETLEDLGAEMVRDESVKIEEGVLTGEGVMAGEEKREEQLEEGEEVEEEEEEGEEVEDEPMGIIDEDLGHGEGSKAGEKRRTDEKKPKWKEKKGRSIIGDRVEKRRTKQAGNAKGGGEGRRSRTSREDRSLEAQLQEEIYRNENRKEEQQSQGDEPTDDQLYPTPSPSSGRPPRPTPTGHFSAEQDNEAGMSTAPLVEEDDDDEEDEVATPRPDLPAPGEMIPWGHRYRTVVSVDVGSFGVRVACHRVSPDGGRDVFVIKPSSHFLCPDGSSSTSPFDFSCSLQVGERSLPIKWAFYLMAWNRGFRLTQATRENIKKTLEAVGITTMSAGAQRQLWEQFEPAMGEYLQRLGEEAWDSATSFARHPPDALVLTHPSSWDNVFEGMVRGLFVQHFPDGERWHGLGSDAGIPLSSMSEDWALLHYLLHDADMDLANKAAARRKNQTHLLVIDCGGHTVSYRAVSAAWGDGANGQTYPSFYTQGRCDTIPGGIELYMKYAETAVRDSLARDPALHNVNQAVNILLRIIRSRIISRHDDDRITSSQYTALGALGGRDLRWAANKDVARNMWERAFDESMSRLRKVICDFADRMDMVICTGGSSVHPDVGEKIKNLVRQQAGNHGRTIEFVSPITSGPWSSMVSTWVAQGAAYAFGEQLSVDQYMSLEPQFGLQVAKESFMTRLEMDGPWTEVAVPSLNEMRRAGSVAPGKSRRHVYLTLVCNTIKSGNADRAKVPIHTCYDIRQSRTAFSFGSKYHWRIQRVGPESVRLLCRRKSGQDMVWGCNFRFDIGEQALLWDGGDNFLRPMNESDEAGPARSSSSG